VAVIRLNPLPDGARAKCKNVFPREPSMSVLSNGFVVLHRYGAVRIATVSDKEFRWKSAIFNRS